MSQDYEQQKTVIRNLKVGKIKARAAVAQLVEAGKDLFFAEEAVFHALGGSDIVREGKDGKDYYDDSGKSVEEVNRLMAE